MVKRPLQSSPILQSAPSQPIDGDADDLFGKTVAKLTKRIPDELMKEMAKIECQQILFRYRFQQQQQNPQNQVGSPHHHCLLPIPHVTTTVLPLLLRHLFNLKCLDATHSLHYQNQAQPQVRCKDILSTLPTIYLIVSWTLLYTLCKKRNEISNVLHLLLFLLLTPPPSKGSVTLH